MQIQGEGGESAQNVVSATMKLHIITKYNPDISTEDELGEKWNALESKNTKGSLKEMRLLYKKIEYLKERVLYLQWGKMEIKKSKNSEKETHLIQKKIEFLEDRILVLEDELSKLTANRGTIKENRDYREDSEQKLEEMKNRVASDLTKQGYK